MKVLHITTIDTGGAYKGALRLHESMQCCGITSKVLVRTKCHAESPVIESNSGFLKKNLSKGKNVINLFYKKGEIHGDRLGTDLSHNMYVQEADVIVLHWVNSFLSVSDIVRLCKLSKPVIWILHDMWLFTGGCHYDRYCNRYTQSCGCCPLIKSEMLKDVTYKNYLQKRKLLKNAEMTIIGPSKWISDCAADSHILESKNIIHIPNTLDLGQYAPLPDKEGLRRKYHIPIDKKVILFGAADQGTENPVKGFSYLAEAIKKMSPQEYALAVFGNVGESLLSLQDYDIYQMGYIMETEKLREIYNLADVFVSPSLQEAFGFTVCEAMACGTPVAAFDVGGNREQIRHRMSGYLAKYQDPADLARGISYCVQHSEELGENAHESAQRYSYENIGMKYTRLLNCVSKADKEK